MPSAPSILVVAATDRELAAGPWRGLVCGVGPVEAAAATAAEIARARPDAVLHLGIAGARRRCGLALGSIVIGGESHYCDIGVSAEWAPGTVGASALLVSAARAALPDAPVMPIGTSARIGGTAGDAGVNIEAMEGFGVLRAAAIARVPAIEIRAISNEIEEDDRARWQFANAFAAITAATPRLVAEIERALRRRASESER
jgi:nucleoside phosphorylase